MTIQTKKFVRHPLFVDAVRIEEDKQLDELAKWCGGRIRQGDPRGQLERYIFLNVHTPLNERQKMAFVGDWILKTEKGFKFFQDEAFNKQFVPAKEHNNENLYE